ncbi:DUF2164 domain-containing protein [Opitutaceae bacterium TAV4]|nr:DUF2164 domain-containing protein [Opitutaceae bacterium TAV4]RRJ99049.1 DUF2164 domain-containing protein [Opitutaceae bacterium TAV3]
MSLDLTNDETARFISSLKKYFKTEYDQALTEIQARQLLGYIQKEIAPTAYNRGVHDAETFFRTKLEDLPASCFEPEMGYWIQSRKRKP